MYLLLLHYKTDLQTVDSHVPDHSKYLQKTMNLGIFSSLADGFPGLVGLSSQELNMKMQ